MTNVRCVLERIKVDGHWQDVIDAEATKARKERKPLTEDEVKSILAKADRIDEEYFRLRTKAIISIANIFGKRRSEIARLKLEDIQVADGFLEIQFTLSKKHKIGRFQYEEIMLKKNPKALEGKTREQIIEDWQSWQQTEQGYKIKETKVTKKTQANSTYAKNIIDYLTYVQVHFKDCLYLFPSSKNVFGTTVISSEKHLSPKTMLELIKEVAPATWMHLYREKKGGQIAKAKGMSLDSIYAVKTTLDLEREATAFNYIRRYAIETVDAEET